MGLRIDLEGDNVFVHDLSVDKIRAYVNGDAPEVGEILDEWFDVAQGPVFTGEKETVYLIIQIER